MRITARDCAIVKKQMTQNSQLGKEGAKIETAVQPVSSAVSPSVAEGVIIDSTTQEYLRLLQMEGFEAANNYAELMNYTPPPGIKTRREKPKQIASPPAELVSPEESHVNKWKFSLFVPGVGLESPCGGFFRCLTF